jgi:hypothetical protein
MLSSEFLPYFEKVPCILPHFSGVYSIDTFPKKIKNRSFFICNMSKSSEKGTHWITIVKSEPKVVEIFDSLGAKIDNLGSYLNFQHSPTVLYNEGAFQSSFSTTCGYFAIMFAIERCFNFDLKYKELLAEIFSEKIEINEKRVTDFCQNL